MLYRVMFLNNVLHSRFLLFLIYTSKNVGNLVQFSVRDLASLPMLFLLLESARFRSSDESFEEIRKPLETTGSSKRTILNPCLNMPS